MPVPPADMGDAHTVYSSHVVPLPLPACFCKVALTMHVQAQDCQGCIPPGYTSGVSRLHAAPHMRCTLSYREARSFERPRGLSYFHQQARTRTCFALSRSLTPVSSVGR